MKNLKNLYFKLYENTILETLSFTKITIFVQLQMEMYIAQIYLLSRVVAPLY